MADGLEAIEPFLGELLDAVAPGQRKRLADRMMRLLRQANARRIAANRTPDGAKMPARKRRQSRNGQAKRGKMFKRIGRASSLKVRTTPDTGELRFANSLVEATAAEHHFGLEGFVGKTRGGRVIRTKYQARALLGFGEERERLLDEVLEHISG